MNYISVFEEAKVNFVKAEDGEEIAWYDITDVIKKLVGGRKSILEYVSKIEMDLYHFYKGKDYGKDKLSIVRDEFESRVKVEEYHRFQCTKYNDEVDAYNDAGSVRLTFNNGAVLDAINSEWGGISLLSGANAKRVPDDHNELFMEEP